MAYQPLVLPGAGVVGAGAGAAEGGDGGHGLQVAAVAFSDEQIKDMEVELADETSSMAEMFRTATPDEKRKLAPVVSELVQRKRQKSRVGDGPAAADGGGAAESPPPLG